MYKDKKYINCMYNLLTFASRNQILYSLVLHRLSVCTVYRVYKIKMLMFTMYHVV